MPAKGQLDQHVGTTLESKKDLEVVATQISVWEILSLESQESESGRGCSIQFLKERILWEMLVKCTF